MAAIREDGARQDTWVVRVNIAGHNFGVWDKKTGGEVDSDATTYYPGAMAGQEDLGGRATTANLVLSRIYDRTDDATSIAILVNGAGKARGTVSQRAMDQDENEVGKSMVWNVRLKRVLFPDVDSESSTAALVEIELTVRGKPTFV